MKQDNEKAWLFFKRSSDLASYISCHVDDRDRMLEPAIAVNSIKKNIKLQLFQVDNKDKSKHSKNSVKQQIQTNIHERMSKKIECQSSFECLCQEDSKHSSRTRVAVA